MNKAWFIILILIIISIAVFLIFKNRTSTTLAPEPESANLEITLPENLPFDAKDNLDQALEELEAIE